MVDYVKKHYGKIRQSKCLFNKPGDFKAEVKALEGKDFELTIKEREEKPVQWNRFYWGVIISTIAKKTGNSVNMAHKGLKLKYLPEIIAVNDKTGERIILDSTTRLTKKQFERYCNLIIAGEADYVYIPMPNEVEY